MPKGPNHIAYLFSRFPVLSQTFCLTEMLAMERHGVRLCAASINPPVDTFRHGFMKNLQAPLLYAPSTQIRRNLQASAMRTGLWPETMVRRHEKEYGEDFKAEERARNALWFAGQFQRLGVQHVHVHFANRATHTALFLKEISGIPFSFTAHAQDFMVDLGSDALLREMCREAAFTAAVSDYSRDVLAEKCPESADKIARVYNGMDLSAFLNPPRETEPPLIVSIGRLIEFKGFDVLIEACARLKQDDIPFRCEIIGDGPLRDPLQARIDQLGLNRQVVLTGPLAQEVVREKLSQCALFALACRIDQKGASDILPTVILEAMASRRPVVSTRLVGVPEMVVDQETGLLVEPDRPGAFADALARLLRNPGQRAAFGEAGRRRVEEVFTVETTAGQLLDRMQKRESPPVEHPTAGSASLLSVWPDHAAFLGAGEIEMIETGSQFGWALQPRKIPPEATPRPSADALCFLPPHEVVRGEFDQSFDPAKTAELQNLGLTPSRLDASLPTAWFLAREFEKRGLQILHAVGAPAVEIGVIMTLLTSVKLAVTLLPGEPLPVPLELLRRTAIMGRAYDNATAKTTGYPRMLPPQSRRARWFHKGRARAEQQEWLRQLQAL